MNASHPYQSRSQHAPQPLRPGDEVHCPHCGHWHLVALRYQEGTPFVREMVFYDCRDGTYYAGQVEGPSRWPTRRASAGSGAARVMETG